MRKRKSADLGGFYDEIRRRGGYDVTHTGSGGRTPVQTPDAFEDDDDGGDEGGGYEPPPPHKQIRLPPGYNRGPDTTLPIRGPPPKKVPLSEFGKPKPPRYEVKGGDDDLGLHLGDRARELADNPTPTGFLTQVGKLIATPAQNFLEGQKQKNAAFAREESDRLNAPNDEYRRQVVAARTHDAQSDRAEEARRARVYADKKALHAKQTHPAVVRRTNPAIGAPPDEEHWTTPINDSALGSQAYQGSGAPPRKPRRPAGPDDNRRKRGELTRQVMKLHNCSMIDASKIISAHRKEIEAAASSE